MATSFLILYPFGAFVIRFLANRLSSPVPLHASIQILTFVITILGISLGIWVSDMNLTHFEYPRHQVFGIVIFILLFFQIPLGYFHHIMYLKTGGRTLISHLHLWNGRAVIACGIVNGGLGLHAAGIKKDVQGVEIGKVEKYWVVVYAVVAGVVGAMYLGAWVAKLVLGSKKGQEGKQGSNGDARYQKRESERDGVMGYE